MSKPDAIARAQHIARMRRDWRYVIWSVEETDAPGQHYHVATDEEADTYYAGVEVVLAIGPDGTVEP